MWKWGGWIRGRSGAKLDGIVAVAAARQYQTDNQDWKFVKNLLRETLVGVINGVARATPGAAVWEVRGLPLLSPRARPGGWKESSRLPWVCMKVELCCGGECLESKAQDDVKGGFDPWPVSAL